MPPKKDRRSRQNYLEKMKPYRLKRFGKMWDEILRRVWKRNKNAKTIDWRGDKILPPVQNHTRPVCVSSAVCSCVSAHYSIRIREVVPPILSLESIVRGVFGEKALIAQMIVIKKDREDVLVEMGRTMPDCDISVEDALKYVMRFGIPLEKDWPLGMAKPLQLQPPEPMYKYMIHGYTVIEDAHEPTVKHMLKQFPLICVCNLSNAVSRYLPGQIYTKKQNDQGKQIEPHAMLLVGWGKSKREYYIVMSNWGTEWGQEGFGFFEKKLIESVYYPTILPLENMPPLDD